MAQLTEKKVKIEIKLKNPVTSVPQYFWITDKSEIMVVECGGRTRVYSSLCPHMGAQMQFCSKDETIHCPWHGLRFNSKTLESRHHRYKHLRELDSDLIGETLVIYE